MDLFLKIPVLQANFCWLGDLEKIICPGKESVSGTIQGVYVYLMSGIAAIPPSPPPPAHNVALCPHPNCPVMC